MIHKLNILVFLLVIISAGGYGGEINQRSGVAIGGYDAVNYFVNKTARKSSKKYSHEWKGTKWYFMNRKNRDAFASKPKHYAPQYGGHCANGLSLGHKVDGDPTIWRIIDKKLYFYYAERGRKRWAENTSQWIKDANKYWTTVRED